MYSLVIYQIAMKRVQRWRDWEIRELETPTKELAQDLDKHAMHKTGMSKVLAEFSSSLFHSLDLYSFVALRRFYISKNDKKADFTFYRKICEDLQHDFGELAGVSWWMWIILAMQLASEGFFPLYGAISYVILILLLLTGKKLISVMNDVVKRVYDRFDKDKDKHISSSELDALEHDLADNLSGIEPNFWFGRPKLVMYLIRVIMWQNSQTLCLSVFYWYFGKDSASGFTCYLSTRFPVVLIITLLIAIFGVIHQGLVILPTYSLTLHLSQHRATNDVFTRLASKLHKIEEKVGISIGHHHEHEHGHGHGHGHGHSEEHAYDEHDVKHKQQAAATKHAGESSSKYVVAPKEE